MQGRPCIPGNSMGTTPWLQWRRCYGVACFVCGWIVRDRLGSRFEGGEWAALDPGGYRRGDGGERGAALCGDARVAAWYGLCGVDRDRRGRHRADRHPDVQRARERNATALHRVDLFRDRRAQTRYALT